jgi:hypothetical protein
MGEFALADRDTFITSSPAASSLRGVVLALQAHGCARPCEVLASDTRVGNAVKTVNLGGRIRSEKRRPRFRHPPRSAAQGPSEWLSKGAKPASEPQVAATTDGCKAHEKRDQPKIIAGTKKRGGGRTFKLACHGNGETSTAKFTTAVAMAARSSALRQQPGIDAAAPTMHDPVEDIVAVDCNQAAEEPTITGQKRQLSPPAKLIKSFRSSGLRPRLDREPAAVAEDSKHVQSCFEEVNQPQSIKEVAIPVPVPVVPPVAKVWKIRSSIGAA